MAWRKRNIRKGRKYQKKRKYNRAYKGGQTSQLARVVHTFKREVFRGTFSASLTSLGAPTDCAQAFNYKLSDLPNVTEYQALFDQYKICGIKVKIIPKNVNTGGAANTNQVTGFGQIVTCLDFDDNVTPTSKDQLLQYSNVKVTPNGRMQTRYFTPKMLSEVYRSSVATAYNVINCKWLDMTYADVPTYGLKLWIDAPTQTGSTPPPNNIVASYDIYETFYFKCKTTR